jgi:hypothetical protein
MQVFVYFDKAIVPKVVSLSNKSHYYLFIIQLCFSYFSFKF